MERQYLERRYSSSFVLGSYQRASDVADDLNQPKWQELATVELLQGAHLETLQLFAKCPAEYSMEELLSKDGENGRKFAAAVLAVFSTVTDPNTLTFTLKMTEDFILADVSSRIQYFLAQETADLLTAEPENQPEPQGVYNVAPLTKLINHSSELVQGKAVYLASLMFSRKPEPRALVKASLDFIVDILETSIHKREETEGAFAGALLSLSVLLRNRQIRTLFAETGGVAVLFSVLRTNMRNLAVLYNLVLCLWLSAFEPKVRSSIYAPEISLLISLIRTEPFEKVIRVAMAILRMVLAHSNEREKELSEALLGLGVLKLLESLKGKKAIKDEDLLEDIKWVQETLQENFRVLTTFERHQQELLTEHLTWSSTVHSDLFWKENARKFERNDFDSIKKLIVLLGSPDETTCAIACSDIGRFVQYYPNGKLIIEQLGGKKATMELLQHESLEVQKQALKTCSKIMISHWDQIGL